VGIAQQRNYVSTALPATLAAPLGTTGNPSVVSVPGTWPSTYPYPFSIDVGLGVAEQCLGTGPPTGGGPYSIPCTRGVDGTTAASHSPGALVVHGTSSYEPSLLQKLAAGLTGRPWEFFVSDPAYGAAGNGVVVSDGAMSSSSSQTTLTCATSAPFTPASVGMNIVVSAAGGGGYTPLAATISTYISATQVTLSASCTSTCAAAITWFGTDDTAAIIAAQAAAVAYAQANTGYAEVVFDPLVYIVAANATVGGSTFGNAQIPLPIVSPVSGGQKIQLVFRGTADATALMHWNQLTAQASGAVLACANTTGTNDGTYGPASVIGGPFYGYGGEPGLYTNMLVTIDGVAILVPYNSTFGGFDFFGVAEANVKTARVLAAAIPAIQGGGPIPNIGGYSNISHTWTTGLRMPCAGNNDDCNVAWFSCEGLATGFAPGEHTSWLSVRCIYCINGIQAYGGHGGSGTDAIRGLHASVEVCSYAVAFTSGGAHLDLDTLEIESIGTIVQDPSNLCQGSIGVRGDMSAGYNSSGIVNGGAGIRVINLNQVSGPVTAGVPAAPATTVAQVNAFYRDAQLWLSAAGGTITAVLVDATAVPVAAAAIIGPVLVPSGHSYTPTYTGTLTVTWVLA
jgi:hypothetical protein